jgi:hypothetical protein
MQKKRKENREKVYKSNIILRKSPQEVLLFSEGQSYLLLLSVEVLF